MKREVVIIGGGPAGIVAALNIRNQHPNKKILLIRENKESLIPCGIPYIFNRLKGVNDDLVSDEVLKKKKIEILIDKVLKINEKKKELFLKNEKRINYSKLVLALGSKEIKIPIKGIDKENVFIIKKDPVYLRNLRKKILISKNILIIGGGFIGVELADELSRFKTKSISIVEQFDHLVSANFDKEFSLEIETQLKKRGVTIYTGKRVDEIYGDKKVKGVIISNKKIKADLVIISAGAKPNTELIKNTKIRIGKFGGIIVDDFLESSVKGIFAIGDCVEEKDFFTNKSHLLMLASSACHQARIVSFNLYKKRIKNIGNLNIFSTQVNGISFAACGMTESKAKKINLKILIGKAESPDHHPGTLPDTKKIKIKLIFSKNGRILGGEISGGKSVGEMINIIALSIQNKLNFRDLSFLQIGTHPLLTPPPTTYPIIIASQNAMNI